MKQKSITITIMLFFFFIRLLPMESDAFISRAGGNTISFAQVIGPDTILAGSQKQIHFNKKQLFYDVIDFDSCQILKSASIDSAAGIIDFSRMSDFSSTDGKSVVICKDNTIHVWDINKGDSFVVQNVCYPIDNQEENFSPETLSLHRKKSKYKIKECCVHNGKLTFLYQAKKNSVVLMDSDCQCCEFDGKKFERLLFASDGTIVAWDKRVIQLLSFDREVRNEFSQYNRYCNSIDLYANRTKSNHFISLCHDTDRKKIGVGSFILGDYVCKNPEIAIDCRDSGAFPIADVRGEDILVVAQNGKEFDLYVYDANTGKLKYSCVLKDNPMQSVHGRLEDDGSIKLAKIVQGKLKSEIVDMRQRKPHQD